MMLKKRTFNLLLAGMALVMFAGEAAAAICTSLSAGAWNTAGRWSCGHVPAAADSVVLAHAITLNTSSTITDLTLNAGGSLVDDGSNRVLTITGNATLNGPVNNGGGRVSLNITGNTSVISGTATLTGVRLYTSGTAPSIAAGSTLNFAGSSRFYTGRTQGGATVAGSVLTINGTIGSTVPTATTTFLRLYANSTVIGSSGVINASVSAVTYNTATAKVTNNGSVSVNVVTQNATTNAWTQGANSSLTVTASSTFGSASATTGLIATATGNTVTYTSPAAPTVPYNNTYYNLAGTGVVCPHGFTVLGSDPCGGGGTVSVTMNPGACVNDATVGTRAWAAGLANVGLSDNLYATSNTLALTGTQLTNYLKCTNYSFAIPAGATINGIAVRVERKISSTTRTTAKDNAMRIVKAGAIGTTDRSTATLYTAADVAEVHGGAADLWGQIWTPADINAATFGAAFSANVTTTRANARTVSVDHMPITVTYTPAATAPHHIQIDHDGAGQTCRAETLTVTACANASCTAPHFTAATVTGNVTWAGSPGGSLPFTIASGGTGQTTVLLPVTTAQTVTLGTSAISPAQTNPPSTCVNAGGGAACSMTFTSATSCFDAVEVGATLTPLYTKLAGTAFSLDITASSTYSGTLQVELVNAASGICSTYPNLSTQSTTFTSQIRKTLSFSYASAAREVKVRITGLASSSCSSGRFVIRPASLAITGSANADATGSNAGATPTVRAGSAFTLNATANALGYDGTPKVDNTKLLVHAGAVATGNVAGVFGAANPATGLATGSSFSYSEVGYFKADVNGVYDDAYTAIDAAAGDCTNDFSNTLVGGKYGCKFGNAAASAYFGRFVPDHFGVVPGGIDNRADWCDQGILVADGVTPCISPAFTYMGEPFNVNFTLSAANSANATTQNYTGAYAKLNPLASDATLAFGAVDTTAPTPLTARLDTSLVALNGSGAFSNGSAIMSVPLAITRGAAADGPYAALDIGIAPLDSDGVTTVKDLDTNNDTNFDHTRVNVADTEVRYGRLRIGGAYGSELLGLSLPVKVEYWNGSAYTLCADDNESPVTVGLANYLGNLNAGETVLTQPVIAGGAGQVRLSAPGAGNQGSVDVSAIAPAYLPGNTARATFGVYKGSNELIYMREGY